MRVSFSRIQIKYTRFDRALGFQYMSDDNLSAFFARLAANRSAQLGDLDPRTVESFGIEVRSGLAVLDSSIELLDARAIRDGLSPESKAWLTSLRVEPATGSTNSDLMQLASQGIDGCVLLAETQLGGRGRRGRTWLSPFARNIALSMGVEIRRKGHELGSLSLMVGLAILKALESLEVGKLALKWPNDILLEGRKLCGVLIEVDHSRVLPQAVIGIGINHGGAHLVRGRIDQDLADLNEETPMPGRNETVAAVVSSVHNHRMRFNEQGFAPFAREWESHHLYQGNPVRVTGGGRDVSGVALGVTNIGELRLQTDVGEERISGGEISMLLDAPTSR